MHCVDVGAVKASVSDCTASVLEDFDGKIASMGASLRKGSAEAGRALSEALQELKDDFHAAAEGGRGIQSPI